MMYAVSLISGILEQYEPPLQFASAKIFFLITLKICYFFYKDFKIRQFDLLVFSKYLQKGQITLLPLMYNK